MCVLKGKEVWAADGTTMGETKVINVKVGGQREGIGGKKAKERQRKIERANGERQR